MNLLLKQRNGYCSLHAANTSAHAEQRSCAHAEESRHQQANPTEKALRMQPTLLPPPPWTSQTSRTGLRLESLGCTFCHRCRKNVPRSGQWPLARDKATQTEQSSSRAGWKACSGTARRARHHEDGKEGRLLNEYSMSPYGAHPCILTWKKSTGTKEKSDGGSYCISAFSFERCPTPSSLTEKTRPEFNSTSMSRMSMGYKTQVKKRHPTRQTSAYWRR
ncbi:uncharacterized protein LOC122423415 isoform X1 [Cervus canadensis]|uniref:uncharacterized protein LOC122423415 isoform X1 n=1 Tax=Cervus canadensis TaxID=1574408 RepID=UPI001CA339FA|nr:uncharacterized protein LOC122423415 isoform X1 [Cervus canadensis]